MSSVSPSTIDRYVVARGESISGAIDFARARAALFRDGVDGELTFTDTGDDPDVVGSLDCARARAFARLRASGQLSARCDLYAHLIARAVDVDGSLDLDLARACARDNVRLDVCHQLLVDVGDDVVYGSIDLARARAGFSAVDGFLFARARDQIHTRPQVAQ